MRHEDEKCCMKFIFCDIVGGQVVLINLSIPLIILDFRMYLASS
jgi:hypothetical protein